MIRTITRFGVLGVGSIGDCAKWENIYEPETERMDGKKPSMAIAK